MDRKNLIRKNVVFDLNKLVKTKVLYVYRVFVRMFP